MLVKMKNIGNSLSILAKEQNIKSIEWQENTYSISFSSSILDFESVWPKTDELRNVLLSQAYLKTIESAKTDLKGFLYAVVYNAFEEPVYFYYFQYKQFNAADSLNYTLNDSLWNRLKNKVKRSVASIIHARGLVCGNLMVTGDHGRIAADRSDAKLDDWQFHTLVHEQALLASKEYGHNVGFLLAKDFKEEAPSNLSIDWNSVTVQPNMVFYLRPNWTDLPSYMSDMTSKYRKRTRSALRKVDDFVFKEVEVDEILVHIDRIYDLYLEIVQRAPFNMFILTKQYFIDLKKNLGPLCDFTLVFDENNLIAFQINIVNNDEYEAHFLGYNQAQLISHDLYLNLLLNSVKLALARKSDKIIFSRTAMQIKSSIGSVPEELYLYLTIRNGILNKLVKLAFKFFNPPVVFDQRHPFKK